MMNTTQISLSRALQALEPWRWRLGMRSEWSQLPEHGGHRMAHAATADGRAYDDPWFAPVRGRWNCDGPALDDPGTVGVLWDWLVALDPSSTWSLTEGWGRATVSRDTGGGPDSTRSWSVLGSRGEAVAEALLEVLR